jgi:hypothetical protein
MIRDPQHGDEPITIDESSITIDESCSNARVHMQTDRKMHVDREIQHMGRERESYLYSGFPVVTGLVFGW